MSQVSLGEFLVVHIKNTVQGPILDSKANASTKALMGQTCNFLTK